MIPFKPTIHALLREPLTWIFYCFFQPTRFKRELEVASARLRLVRMCQLASPIFFFAFPLALVARILFARLFPSLYADYFIGHHIDQGPFVFDAIWAALLVMSVTVLVGGLFGLAYGITVGIVGTFWVALTGVNLDGSVLSIAGPIIYIAGIVGGVAIGSAPDIARSRRVETGIGNAVGMLLGILLGTLLALAVGNLVGPVVYIWGSQSQYRSDVADIIATLLGAAFAALFIAAFLSVLRGSTSRRPFRPGIERGIPVGMATCFATSTAISPLMSIAVHTGFLNELKTTIVPNLPMVAIAFVGYMLGYYRLPLYLASGCSSLKAYLASRRNPPGVFSNLRHSSLRWDECAFLPLPCLKRSLYLAIEQDIQQTLEEIAFIVTERPTQISDARAAALEIALRDLEARETLRHIAQAADRLTENLPQKAGLIDPHWVASFARLNDASREAARFMTLMSRQARRDALDEMVLNLKRVPHRAFDDDALDERVQRIVKRWLAAAQQHLDKIAWIPEESGHIENPYTSGAALEPHSQQFVGRYDLVRQLEYALRKGENRPCFFLTGERRMGKTSTLNQLPVLLGARYIPLIFDLQARGSSANAAAFLFSIAHDAYKEMDARGIRVPQLEYDTLDEARRENEAMVYFLFDRWLSKVESALKREDRLLLIAFDEFEKLEEASLARYLDIQLLLDWFRNVIQHRPRLALLFSGVKTPGEMEEKWAGHFVNVQTLRVSFLHPTDARQLITRPVPDYPSEQLFGEGVVDEIIRVTGCHPFLVQAVCCELIDILNVDLRDRANARDVDMAVDSVLESWGDYFRDLWRRTDQEQQVCLQALRNLGKATAHRISAYCALEEYRAQLALQTLCKRDLARIDQGVYQIAAPIFRTWLERHSHTN